MSHVCRHCNTELNHEFLNLKSAPPSNAYLNQADLVKPETWYPLRLKVCGSCFLVQTEDFARSDELFTNDYAYFSATSRSWLRHAENYSSMITNRLDLNADSFVIEVASNDGYLLKNFVAADIPCLGIEPTSSTAEKARELGVPVLEEFFGEALAASVRKADLIIGNNVYAHVPDINDFTRGLSAALKPTGVVTLEFPHLMRLVEFKQFDTVYHEHFSYLSLVSVEKIMTSAGLKVFDVEEISTHGGSLRIYACHIDAEFEESESLRAVRREELARGMADLNYYYEFQSEVEAVCSSVIRFLEDIQDSGKSIAGYGAAAKGNTLLNFIGVKSDLIPYVCDAAPAKIGKYLPGSHIPIYSPDRLRDAPPDYLLIFPWNIAEEVSEQLGFLKEFGTQFVTCIPRLKVW